MKKLVYFLFLLLLAQFLKAQCDEIFSELTGEGLRNSIVESYKTNTVLSYDKARDTLFSKIYNHDDSLTCVYTGYTVYMDPNEDPTTYVYNNYNFQTEHTWPQSKGAVDQAESDMHHLYPVWGSVNASRGNLPFEELYELNTDKWWGVNTSYTEEPTDIVDQCSKKGEDSFEPREDHKGNVARAMFYFYTMYQTEADLEDPEFFNIQHEDLHLTVMKT
jgi:hypothetical protein